MSDVKKFFYFCEKCAIRGCLIAKPAEPVSTNEQTEQLEQTVLELRKTINDLSAQLTKLQAEVGSVRSTSKKQIDQIRSSVNNADQRENRCAVQSALVNSIGDKLETITAGAKLAQSCTQSVNSCRLAINKIPFREGENVRSIVESVTDLLGVPEVMASVTSCFRVDVKPSKWSDRALTPTIVAVFDSHGARERVLRRYFERHKDAKLCQLKNAPDLEYRFTVNEMLSVQAFRIRNLALRLKLRKLIRSVFVRNDNISVLLPGHKRYTAVDSTEHLLDLVGPNPEADDSSVFFDALSSDGLSSSRC